VGKKVGKKLTQAGFELVQKSRNPEITVQIEKSPWKSAV
jgi:hypothetical protein